MWWACPSYSGCDSEIAFPLDAGCKRQGIKLKFELKGIFNTRMRTVRVGFNLGARAQAHERSSAHNYVEFGSNIAPAGHV